MGTYNAKKLSDLELALAGKRGEIARVDDQLRDISWRLNPHHERLRGFISGQERGEIEKYVAVIEREKVPIAERRSALQRELGDLNALYTNCREFLRSKGIQR